MIHPFGEFATSTACRVSATFPTESTDVKHFKYDAFDGIDLITGGPPCQPFSMGSKHGGFLDERDIFPQAVRAVREVRPRAFVFENVQGLRSPPSPTTSTISGCSWSFRH